MSEAVKRGDKFVHHNEDEGAWPLFIEVTRVARDGSWCDIRCYTWAMTWTKRMPQGMAPMLASEAPFRVVREDWTPADVLRSEPSFVGGGV